MVFAFIGSPLFGSSVHSRTWGHALSKLVLGDSTTQKRTNYLGAAVIDIRLGFDSITAAFGG
jgi:hypothetical protein